MPREPCTTRVSRRASTAAANVTVASLSGCLSGCIRIARLRYARLTSAWEDESWMSSKLKIVCREPALVLNAVRKMLAIIFFFR